MIPLLPMPLIIAVALLSMLSAGLAIYLVFRPYLLNGQRFGTTAYGNAGRQGTVVPFPARIVARWNREQAHRARTSRVLDVASDAERTRTSARVHSSNSLAKKLRYARWSISPWVFRAVQILLTAIAVLSVSRCTIYIVGITALLTPLLVEDILEWRIRKRFEAFDRDYPVMLMQFVSFIKGGMMTMSAFEKASEGLPPGGLIRQEIAVLVDRLRMGLSEYIAIGAFGEDVAHPEIELFVQSLLLHTKMGGKITPTLERLARQVRKRQQFRREAVAVISMERMSIWAVSAIMIFILLYIFIKSPELVVSAFQSDLGIAVFQGGVAAILAGFYWGKEVSKIKV